MFFKKKTADSGRGAEPFFVAYRDADPNGAVTVQIDPDLIESPAHGGLMLADFARHMARAMSQTGKAESEAQALDTILNLFQAELDNPTCPIQGSMQN